MKGSKQRRHLLHFKVLSLFGEIILHFRRGKRQHLLEKVSPFAAPFNESLIYRMLPMAFALPSQ
jgi:hypothetical protein